MINKKIVIKFNTDIKNEKEFKKFNPNDEYVEFEKSIAWKEFKHELENMFDNFSYFNVYDLEIKIEKDNGE